MPTQIFVVVMWFIFNLSKSVLHRVMLITTALLPVYNHVLLTIPVDPHIQQNSIRTIDQASGWSNGAEEKVSNKQEAGSRTRKGVGAGYSTAG
jgi:hypothetical protein